MERQRWRDGDGEMKTERQRWRAKTEAETGASRVATGLGSAQ